MASLMDGASFASTLIMISLRVFPFSNGQQGLVVRLFANDGIDLQAVEFLSVVDFGQSFFNTPAQDPFILVGLLLPGVESNFHW